MIRLTDPPNVTLAVIVNLKQQNKNKLACLYELTVTAVAFTPSIGFDGDVGKMLI